MFGCVVKNLLTCKLPLVIHFTNNRKSKNLSHQTKSQKSDWSDLKIVACVRARWLGGVLASSVLAELVTFMKTFIVRYLNLLTPFSIWPFQVLCRTVFSRKILKFHVKLQIYTGSCQMSLRKKNVEIEMEKSSGLHIWSFPIYFAFFGYKTSCLLLPKRV